MISRGEMIGRLRELNYTFDEQGKHTELYRPKGGGPQRVALPRRKSFTPDEARSIFRQARDTEEGIDRFLRSCLKESDP